MAVSYAGERVYRSPFAVRRSQFAVDRLALDSLVARDAGREWDLCDLSRLRTENREL